MTTELTKAAQQALEALRRAVPKDSEQAHEQLLAVQALNTALTHRPAAQTEREAFESAALAKWGPLDFERSEVEPEMYYNQRLDDAWIGFGFAVAWLRASLPAPQQATPEPVGEVAAWQRRDRNIVTGEWSAWREDDDIEEVLDPEWAERRPLFTRPAPGVPEGFTLDQIADACVQAEISDSKFESLSIALAAAQAKGGV